eukprot:g43205.t1
MQTTMAASYVTAGMRRNAYGGKTGYYTRHDRDRQRQDRAARNGCKAKHESDTGTALRRQRRACITESGKAARHGGKAEHQPGKAAHKGCNAIHDSGKEEHDGGKAEHLIESGKAEPDKEDG